MEIVTVEIKRGAKGVEKDTIANIERGNETDDRDRESNPRGTALAYLCHYFELLEAQTAVIVVKRHNNLTMAIMPRNWCKCQITAKKERETPLFGSFRQFSSDFDP